MKTGLYLGETPIGRIVVTSTSSSGINLQSKTITPSKSLQTVIADNNYEGLSSVTVQPIPNNYIDTNGATATADQIQIGETAYVNGKLVTGELAVYEGEITYNAKNISQSNNKYMVSTSISDKCIVNENATILIQGSLSTLGNATANQVLAGNTFTSSAGIAVTGTHICGGGVDASDATASPEHILEGFTAYIDSSGKAAQGTMKNNSSASLKVEGNKVSIPADGYYTTSQFGTVGTATLNNPYATSATINADGSIIVKTAYVPAVGYNSSTTTKTGSTTLTSNLSTDTWTLTDINGNTSTITVVNI